MGTDDTQETGDLTVIAIPEDKVQEVADFIASLETSETDVSGHMISRGMVGGFGGALSARMTTSTGCLSSVTGKLGMDMRCADTDKIVTN